MWVIVTGASSGIGKDIAKELADKGYKLVLVARRENKLKELSKELDIECKVVVADLIAENGCEKVYQACKDLDISILVNNAGFGGHGKFETRPLKDDMSMIDLNIKALTKLAHLFIPMLKKSPEKSYLLNVASSAGFMPGPGMAVYFATKAYVLSLSEALSEELKGEVSVSALCPGPVKTEFAKVADMKGVEAFESGAHSSKFVAKKAVEGMFKGKAVIIPGAMLAFLLRFALRLMPRGLVRKVSGKAMSKV